MNSILLYFLLTALPLGDSIQEPLTDVTQYYHDSVRLYNVYKYQIDYLKNMNEADTAEWNRKAKRDHLITCAMQQGLKKYNRQEYLPIDSFLRKDCETAYAYPKPSDAHSTGLTIPMESKVRCVVYDKQTRFIVKDNHRTRTPYITKIIFDKDRTPGIEKLDPVTFKKIAE